MTETTRPLSSPRRRGAARGLGVALAVAAAVATGGCGGSGSSGGGGRRAPATLPDDGSIVTFDAPVRASDGAAGERAQRLGDRAAIAVSGDRVLVAWVDDRTGADEAFVAASDDGGESFGRPIQVSDADLVVRDAAQVAGAPVVGIAVDAGGALDAAAIVDVFTITVTTGGAIDGTAEVAVTSATGDDGPAAAPVFDEVAIALGAAGRGATITFDGPTGAEALLAGQVFEVAIEAPATRDPAVRLRAGRAAVAFVEDGALLVAASDDAGASFAAPAAASDAGAPAVVRLSLDLDDTGTVRVLWESVVDLRADRDDGAGFGADAIVEVNATIISEGFEAGQPAGFAVAGGVWEFGAPLQDPPGQAAAGQNVAATGLAADYPNDSDASLVIEGLDLSNVSQAVLSLEQFFDIESGFDSGRIEASVDGVTFFVLTPDGGYPDAVDDDGIDQGAFSGVSNGLPYESVSVDLSPFCGVGLDDVDVRFRLRSDGSVTAPGWFVDEVEVAVNPAPALIAEGFEGGALPGTFLIDDTTTDIWQVGTPVTFGPLIDDVAIGSNGAATVLAADYPSNANTGLITPAFDLSGAVDARLVFLHLFDIETAFDFGFVQVSTNGQAGPFVTIDPEGGYPGGVGYTGTIPRYETAVFDLGAFVGQPDVAVRFLFQSDGVVEQQGWFIDQIRVVADDGTAGASFREPALVVTADGQDVGAVFIEEGLGGEDVVFARSDDGGLSFPANQRAIVDDGDPATTRRQPFGARLGADVVVVWADDRASGGAAGATDVFAATSADGGGSFGADVQVNADDVAASSERAPAVVMDLDGRVTVAFTGQVPNRFNVDPSSAGGFGETLFVAESLDGGASFAPAPSAIGEIAGRGTIEQHGLAGDPDTGAVIVAWAEDRVTAGRVSPDLIIARARRVADLDAGEQAVLAEELDDPFDGIEGLEPDVVLVGALAANEVERAFRLFVPADARSIRLVLAGPNGPDRFDPLPVDLDLGITAEEVPATQHGGSGLIVASHVSQSDGAVAETIDVTPVPELPGDDLNESALVPGVEAIVLVRRAPGAAGRAPFTLIAEVATDQTPPRIIDVDPAEGALDVPLATVTLTFSDFLDAGSIDAQSVLVFDEGNGGAPVAADVAVGADLRTIVVTPAADTFFPFGTTVRFEVSGTIENAVGLALGADTILRYDTPFDLLREGFEGVGLPAGWALDEGAAPTWELGAPTSGPGAAAAGANVAATGLAIDYPNDADARLVTIEVDLSTVTSASLTFQHFFDIESFFDGGQIEVSVGGQGGVFVLVDPVGGYNDTVNGGAEGAFGGRSDGFEGVEVDLTPFVGNATVAVRFRLTSDGSVTGPGWFVDEVLVVGR